MNAKHRMKSSKQLVSRGNVNFVKVLVGYGSNDNRLRVSEMVHWIVCHSDCTHLLQRLLPATHQFSEPE